MRVLLFGIDGLTFRILHPLMERGLLPNFQRLHNDGVQGVLQSTVPPLAPPGWMSISTGLSPAKHGVYDFWDFEQTEQGLQTHVVTHRKGGKAIWNILSEWGKQVVVANVPITYPPEPVNGIMLSGYMAPSMEADVTFPTSFKEELLQAVPNYQIDLNPAVSSSQGDNLLSETLVLTRNRITMLRLLLSKPWDFFFIVFTGADRIQHLRWDEIMAFSPQAVQYYQMLDEALGIALKALKPEDMLMVVSDHGFQGAHRKFYIQEYLHKHELLRMSHRSARLRVELVDWTRSLVWAMGLRNVPTRLRRQLHRLGVIPTTKKHPVVPIPDLDWANTLAWLPSSSGSIAGYADILFADTMTEEGISELRSALQEIRHPETGQTLLTQTYREDIFGTGPFAPRERHLVLLSHENIALLPDLGPRQLWNRWDMSSGIHHSDGVLYLYGAGIKKGITISPTHVYDVVPTILSYMGISLPAELDGTMMKDAFEQPPSSHPNAKGDSDLKRKLSMLAN